VAERVRTVIIVAPADDLHALAVAHQLREIGGTATILDSRDFPVHWHISLRIQKGNVGFDVVSVGATISDRDLAGLWWRRPNLPQIADEVTDPAIIEFCQNESTALLHGLLFSLGSKVINPLIAHRSGRNKPYQLAIAQSLGLRVPRTLVTSSPEHVAVFRDDLNADTVFKILTPAPEQRLIETRILDDRHTASLGAIRVAPLIFQEKIDKVADIRVTVIDRQCFSVECKTDTGALDWRVAPAIRYVPHALPDFVADQLLALHRTLGLRYGAVDLCVTSDGDYVFLETNVSGQFIFGEIEADLPLTRAMAHALLEPPAAPLSPHVGP
jgi:glutathione synthase/RimK-type ligase-like ATP-grasp enzyme